LGFAGALSESSSSESSSEDEGRSPGAAGFWDLRLMAASFLAFAAARRCSRVNSGLSAPSSEDDSSSELSSSSEEEDSASSLSCGSWMNSWL